MTDYYQEQQQARRKALRLLEHMDRTERGLTDRLRQAGFSEEAEELEAPDEHALLLNQIEKKYPPDTEIDERQMRRLLGYFARRGFRQGEITSALEELHITLCKNIQTNG